MGTPEFAVPSLEVLVQNNFNVVGVITAVDKPSGRGKKVNISAVKKYALAHNLNILQPTNLKDPEFIKELELLKPDIQLVVAFRMLPEVVWSIPPLGTFNIHASLLPQYRGAAPINHAIINGETETGLSSFLLKKEIDTGDIIHQVKTQITPSQSAGELHDHLMMMSPSLVLKTIESLLKGNILLKPQKTSGTIIKTAPKIFKKDCRINWNKSSIEIFNFIRGFSPYPCSFTQLVSPQGKTFKTKIFKADQITIDKQMIPGTILTDGINHLNIYCLEGCLSILEIQLEGKRKMPIKDFLRGFTMDDKWRSV